MSVWRSVSRSVLVFTNVFFLLLGAVLITLGGYMITIPDLNAFSEGGISGAVICCGLLILAIALLGCCGAQWDSKAFLCPYAILVVVSVVTQLILAGFMFHVHGSLMTIADHNFDLHVLSSGDRKILKWINKRFEHAYEHCDPSINIDLTLREHALIATCSRPQYDWFAAFIQTNCRIDSSDLQVGSYFMKCAGNYDFGSALDEHTMLCACESKMVNWINDQSFLIGVFVASIALFEVALVFLSCYVMCTTRRRMGYQEIRMPLKQEYNPFNAREFFNANSTSNSFVNTHESLQPPVVNGGQMQRAPQQQPYYHSQQQGYGYAPVPSAPTQGSYPFATPVMDGERSPTKSKTYGSGL